MLMYEGIGKTRLHCGTLESRWWLHHLCCYNFGKYPMDLGVQTRTFVSMSHCVVWNAAFHKSFFLSLEADIFPNIPEVLYANYLERNPRHVEHHLSKSLHLIHTVHTVLSNRMLASILHIQQMQCCQNECWLHNIKGRVLQDTVMNCHRLYAHYGVRPFILLLWPWLLWRYEK